MRQMVLALALAAAGGFAVASCGNSNNNGDGGTGDMSGGGPPPDLAIAKTNCMQMAQCVYTCISGGSDINTCATQCGKNAKAGSATKWTNAVICGQNFCLGDKDMMTGKCISLTPPGMPTANPNLCDPGIDYATCNDPNHMSTSCLPCLDQARNIWIYDISVDPANPGPPTGMCSDPTGADCSGAKALCMTQFNACLNDT
jgi:hypothetical protein